MSLIILSSWKHWQTVNEELAKPREKAEFSVLDGGSLLHRLSWGKGDTDEVCDILQ